MKRVIKLGVMVLGGILLTACGTEGNQLSPQEVVNTVLQESVEPLSYYGEYTMMDNNDTEDYEAKEWISKDQKSRLEMTATETGEQLIAVNDGESVSMYDEASNIATIMEIGEEEMRKMNSQSPRQQAEQMLEMVKDSHELSTGEDEEIAGRSTYHIIAKAKKDSSLLGDIDLWIDKETWLPLKTVTSNGGSKLTIEYTKVDFKAEMSDDLFVLDIPEDATVEVMDEEAYEAEEVTLEDVKEELGSFYQLQEEDNLELAKITVVEGIENRLEFSFEYMKDEMAALSVNVFKDLPNVEDFGSLDEEEEITIRGNKATKMEMGEFRSLDWTEEGLRYVVLIDNPEIEFEDIEQYIEKMTLVE